MPQMHKQNFLQKWGGILLFVLLTIGWVGQTQTARDITSGWGYKADATATEIRDALSLTGYGQRVFAAVQPVIETSDFNQHCENTNEGTNVLGCYLPNDDRVYVYNITLDELKVSQKSTMAHELLHAVWERLSNGDKRKLNDLLSEEYQRHESELGEILGYYDSENQMTELFARIGTEVSDISEELEKYYARVFEDRQQIVQYYHEYVEPLKKLRAQADELKEKILRVKAEITAERTEYELASAELENDINKFNNCANQAGCFTTEAGFRRERQALEQRQKEVEGLRTVLNEKIVENNESIRQFNEYQEKLGALNDAMDSTAVIEQAN